jgi:hypothetical protein
LLDATLDLAARQQDAPTAAFAFEPYIRAQANDAPIGAAAGVLLAQAYPVIQAEIGILHNTHPLIT